MNLQGITTAVNAPSGDELRTLAMAEILKEGKLFPYAQFYQITGNADKPRKAQTDTSTGAARTVGSSGSTYTAGEQDPQFGDVALKTVGFEVSTDVAFERRGGDIGSQRAKDLAKRAREYSRYLSTILIKSDGSGNLPKGLEKLAIDLSLDVVLGGGSDGYEVPSGDGTGAKAKKNTFLEAIDGMVALVDPTVIYCNSQVISRLQTIGREFVRTTNVTDIYGKGQVVSTYRDRPLVDVGYNTNRSAQIINNTETVGDSDDCTSMYFVRYGEEEYVTLAGNNGVNVYDLGQVGTKYKTMIEMDIDQVVLDPYCLRRLSGIRLTNA